MASLEETVHEIAVRALRQQEQELIELRARTGTLLTASSLIASFLGTQAIARNGLSVLVALALLAFGASAVISIYVLLPKRRVVFALDGIEIYEALYETSENGDEIQRKLAYWIQGSRVKNEPIVNRVTHAFEIAGLALFVEIALLALGLTLS